MRIYMAGPLFNTGETSFNSAVRDAILNLQPTWDVVLPQELAGNLVPKATLAAIYEADVEEITKADVICACCNGTQVDDGTAYEIGYARAIGKRTIAWRADLRKAGDGNGVNLMISHGVDTYVELPFTATAAEVAAKIVSVI